MKELLLESVGLKICWVMHVESSNKFFTVFIILSLINYLDTTKVNCKF